MPESNPMDLSPELIAWVEKTSGAKCVSARRLYGGGSRVTILIDAQSTNGKKLPLVLRLEGGGSHSGTSFSLEREFHVYRALENRDIPVPKAYGLTTDGSALLLERLEGASEFRQMPEAEQIVVAKRFMEAFGALHSLDARELDLPGFEVPKSATEHATIDLGRWEELARTSCWNEPIIRYAFSRLRSQAPSHVQRTVLVQGDTGPGNFMATSDRVTGIIDWEFAHIGDPMDDIGWLKNRASDTLPLFEAAFPDYERISGIKIEPASVSYYNRMAVLRCAVTVALGVHKGGALGVIPYRFVYRNYLSRLADHLIADAGLGLAREEMPSPQATTPLYAEARSDLRNFALKEVQSNRGQVAIQAALTALTHLELRDRFGREFDERDHQQRDALFGANEYSLPDEAERAGKTGDEQVLTYLARRAWRERSLWPR